MCLCNQLFLLLTVVEILKKNWKIQLLTENKIIRQLNGWKGFSKF